MNTATTVEGIIKSDGTLELQDKMSLSPGRVTVTITPIPELPSDDPFWQMLQGIWNGQKARGHVARSVHDVEKERRETRDEWDTRMREIERIQEEARMLRESSG